MDWYYHLWEDRTHNYDNSNYLTGILEKLQRKIFIFFIDNEYSCTCSSFSYKRERYIDSTWMQVLATKKLPKMTSFNLSWNLTAVSMSNYIIVQSKIHQIQSVRGYKIPLECSGINWFDNVLWHAYRLEH